MYNKLLSTVVLFLLVFLLSVKNISAQVVINEFLPNPSSGEDWVELYSETDLDISGWILDDGHNTSTDMATVGQGIVIGPSTSKYYSINVGSRLNQSDDFVYLLKPDRSNVDSKEYTSAPASDVSIGRYPDGQSWGMCTPSKNSQNSSCTFPTPVPTATPTSTPNPTSTPTPTSTSTVVPTPVKTLTPKPKATSTPTASPSSSPEVLGETAPPTLSPTQTPESAPGNESNLPIVPIVLIGLGVLSIAAAFFPVIKNFYLSKVKGYNGKTNEDN